MSDLKDKAKKVAEKVFSAIGEIQDEIYSVVGNLPDVSLKTEKLIEELEDSDLYRLATGGVYDDIKYMYDPGEIKKYAEGILDSIKYDVKKGVMDEDKAKEYERLMKDVIKYADEIASYNFRNTEEYSILVDLYNGIDDFMSYL